jgi:hypothetical protein
MSDCNPRELALNPPFERHDRHTGMTVRKRVEGKPSVSVGGHGTCHLVEKCPGNPEPTAISGKNSPFRAIEHRSAFAISDLESDRKPVLIARPRASDHPERMN